MAELAALEARHCETRFTTPPEVFFGEAGEPGPWLRTPVRSIPGDRASRGQVIDVRWQSGYVPLAPEPEVRNAYMQPENAWSHARLWLHRDRPRPTAVLIHGYMGGSYPLEERAWPMRWMFEQLGLDLALPVLPFHGPRNGSRRRPRFPGIDPRFNVEGFRHAVFDLMSLRRALVARGAPAVGLMGMSLGGFTTALTSCADDEVAFAAPIIPLASIADFARDAGRLVGTPEQQGEQHAAIERSVALVSPLGRAPKIASERVRVVAGRADRITPVAHAERLAAHFDAPLCTFYGGHLLQLGRAEGFREIARMLRDLDLLAPR